MPATRPGQSAAEARAVRMLRALANPARFRIVQLLAEQKDCTASQLSQELTVAQSTLSEHLSALREAGIVQPSGDGPHRYFCVDPGALDFLAAYLSGLGQRARSWSGLVRHVEMEGSVQIRDATAGDAAAIARIYNQGIEDRVATLETALRSSEERAEWMAAKSIACIARPNASQTARTSASSVVIRSPRSGLARPDPPGVSPNPGLLILYQRRCSNAQSRIWRVVERLGGTG